MSKLSEQVFGVSNEILEDSYVDRGGLDKELMRDLRRKNHVALRGASKSGKTWLRKKVIDDGIIIQCRFGTTIADIYIDALSQLGIKLIIEETKGDILKGRVESTVQAGWDLIAKIKLKFGLEATQEDTAKATPVGHDINDLRFVAEIIIESGRRLVIEDFHYLSIEERRKFAFDLKALWDYGCFVIIVGVWTRSNLLIALNPDLSDRIVESSVDWTDSELRQVVMKGTSALKIQFSDGLISKIVLDCYKNVGLLQKLVLSFLDEAGVEEEFEQYTEFTNIELYESAAMSHAEQLDTLYQKFAKDVSSGIRKRKDSTGIYAHAMAAIVDTCDELLLNGLPIDDILNIASARQPRIIKTNLRVVLQKLEELQVDSEGRGLVIAYNEATDEISVIDRRLLFYRKYITINWPWEDLIREHEEENNKDTKQYNLNYE